MVQAPQQRQSNRTAAFPQQRELAVTWESLPKDFILPDDPVENIQQPKLAAALNDALAEAGLLKPETLVASNFALVATVNQKVIVKAPDWLYVPSANPVADGVIRRSYTPHREGGPVAVVMEFLSDEDNSELSVRSSYPYGKLYFYEQILKVPSYCVFDPYNNAALEVRQLEGDRYINQEPNEQGQFWIESMGLFLGVWVGDRLGDTTAWLRWWGAEGNLLLWGSEKAELARLRAEQESLKALQEAQRAEQAAQKAFEEKQRGDRLAEKLRELGLDPNEL